MKGRFRFDNPRVLADAVHLLRLFGRDATCSVPWSDTPVDVLDLILDCDKSRSQFGEPCLIDTREGVRCRKLVQRFAGWQRERQGHEDQLLAILGEVGVPANHPVRTAQGERTVQALVDDLVANCDLGQDEVEWSALSMILYLPPRREWSDKFGSRRTFDDLAIELMGRKLGPGRACAGVHLPYNLAALLQADEQSRVLSPPVRDRVRTYQANLVRMAVQSQNRDGYWGPDWYTGASPDPNRPGQGQTGIAEVLVTGHVLEWLTLLPPDLLPPRERIQTAARWLKNEVIEADRETVTEWYCPYSHAARALLVLNAGEAN